MKKLIVSLLVTIVFYSCSSSPSLQERKNMQSITNSNKIIEPLEWTAVSDNILNSFSRFALFDIAYGAGKFVAVGYIWGNSSGIIIYSKDGTTWTVVDSTTFGKNMNIECIAYGNGMFVAGGGNGKIAYSRDGINWNSVSDSKFGTKSISSLTFGNGKFVAGGRNEIAYSSDAINWIATDSTFGSEGLGITCITFGNGRFIAVGNDKLGEGYRIAYSDNGVNWISSANKTISSKGIYSIAYGDKKFVAVGDDGIIVYSNDGISWVTVVDSTLGLENMSLSCIIFANNKFIAGGSDSKILYSSNGINWTSVSIISSFDGSPIQSISYGGDKYVAIGGNNIAYSTISQ